MARNMKYTLKVKLKSILYSIFTLALGSNLDAQTAGVSHAEGITTLGSDTIHCPDIVQGDTIFAVFYIHNFGTQPVKIYQVHPGCQCTTPAFHDSLFPGQTDSIVLVFYSRKHHEPAFLKGAIVLNNVLERNYYVEGKMKMLPEGTKHKNRSYRHTNQYLVKKPSN